jgi:hypothetical protein
LEDNTRTHKISFSKIPGMCREPPNVSFAAEFPAYWSDMKQQNLCVVQLHPADPEYNTVASKFKETCSSFVIEKVSLLLTWNFLMIEIKVITVLYKTFHSLPRCLICQELQLGW